MTSDEKLQKLKDRIPDEDLVGVSGKLLLSLLENTKYIILNVEYPYSKELPDDVEPRYEFLQISMAIELFNKVGIEGEVSHTENGISRTFSTADVSTSLLEQITPMCGV